MPTTSTVLGVQDATVPKLLPEVEKNAKVPSEGCTLGPKLGSILGVPLGNKLGNSVDGILDTMFEGSALGAGLVSSDGALLAEGAELATKLGSLL